MGWILFLGSAIVSILKTIVKALVWIFTVLFKAFVFIAKFVFNIGFGWLLVYCSMGGLLYFLGFLGKDSVGLIMFKWGFIPIGLLTLLSIALKRRKKSQTEKKSPVDIVTENSQTRNTDETIPSDQLLRKFKDVVNANILVHEYIDRFERYLLLPEGLQLVEIIQKNDDKKKPGKKRR